MADVALIQEPMICSSPIRGKITSEETIFSVAPDENAKSCICQEIN
jgi:hypothetical protein